MDCIYGQVWVADHCSRKRELGKILVPDRVDGTPATALVNSGCSQTIIHASLVKATNLAGASIWLQCIHGDMKPYPTIWVQVEAAHQEGQCLVGASPKLAYPVVLGHDWQGFIGLLQECCTHLSGARGAHPMRRGFLGLPRPYNSTEGPLGNPGTLEIGCPLTEAPMRERQGWLDIDGTS
ncbi:unnamed protein product [Caretta caretta]